MSPPAFRLVWHRRTDLRLDDNPLYDDGSDRVVSVFVFDQSDFQPRPSTCWPERWDAVNVGPHAARALLDSVRDLKTSLESIGGKLLVRRGNPLAEVPQIIDELQSAGTFVNEVVWSEEPGTYEAEQSQKMGRIIKQRFKRTRIRSEISYTLYHPDDLPRDKDVWSRLAQPNQKRSKKKKKPSDDSKSKQALVQGNLPEGMVDIRQARWDGMPRIMGDFRRAAKSAASLRKYLPAPSTLRVPECLSTIHSGTIPSLEELLMPLRTLERPILGVDQKTIDYVCQNAMDLSHHQKHKGGETTGRSRLVDFVENHAATADRSLACVDDNQSSRFSRYLAFGCLSPRQIVRTVEEDSPDCQWLASHMSMRDFFLYTCFANGPKFFGLEGIPVSEKQANSDNIRWRSFSKDEQAQPLWVRWSTGDTGLPLVDAAMREMMQTGYCSNRVRQNAASVLTKDLQLDWRAGAEWFQFLLEDHCVGANWGNWLYFSGVGPDPKQRHFRTVSQALRYDKDGKYVRKWIPELSQVDGDEAHLRPWDYHEGWRELVVPSKTQYTWQDLQRLEEEGALIANQP